ncbi:hypothetical protein KIN20_028471 [Parelaphostrongylus tenuis]|uniref:Uncharacterized protein n=1 Tax=Parelaphostrongylus tenuis TaxID=148309 RepID=A0AAD5R161_PARTN|nr:hypothetical protein KIN20_028471 [Parelaphostrongylus tenuis]
MENIKNSKAIVPQAAPEINIRVDHKGKELSGRCIEERFALFSDRCDWSHAAVIFALYIHDPFFKQIAVDF